MSVMFYVSRSSGVEVIYVHVLPVLKLFMLVIMFLS